jgi:hypothetical protein
VTALESIAVVSSRLKHLAIEHVFIGGAIVPLLLDDPGLHAPRATKDVDAVVKVATNALYAQLENRLRASGFRNVEEGPICPIALQAALSMLCLPTEAF